MSRYERIPGLKRFEMVERSRALRHEATEAERFVWLRINRRQIFGLGFRRQHPIGPYIVDFYCPEKKLILELDGGQHGEPSEKMKDAERTRYFESYGLRVLRFWNSEVFKDWEGVREGICRVVGSGRAPATPTLLP